MDFILHALKIIGLFAALFAVVPIVGLLNTGSPRAAWRYTKDWLRVMGILIASGLVLALVFGAFMQPS